MAYVQKQRGKYRARFADPLGRVQSRTFTRKADAERFLREVPIEFEVLYDSQGVLAEQFKVQGMPSSFVFDRDGKLVGTHLGFRETRRNEHEAEIQTLLSRTKP
jgi:peroxiredoxin